MQREDIKTILNHDGSKAAFYYTDNHIDLSDFMAIVKNIKGEMKNDAIMLANNDLKFGCHAYMKTHQTDDGRFLYDIQEIPFLDCKAVTIVVADTYQDNPVEKFHH